MNTNSFALRHIGPREKEVEEMLEAIGAESIEQLVEQTVPKDIRLDTPLNLAPAMSEHEFLNHIHALGAKNKNYKTYIGLGYHNTHTPSVIKRNILENPGWYTAYTPYQAEIAQGRLEALLNYQTLITELTGMELANASLLDESTAAAEAMTLLFAVRAREQKKNNVVHFFVSDQVLPQTLSLLETRANPLGIKLVVDKAESFNFDEKFFGALLQYPGKEGQILNLEPFIQRAHQAQIKVAVAADLLALVLMKSPGSCGADVVVGTSQRFGIPLGYGGPHAGYFATREEFKRNIPGRIIGVTRDMNDEPALRMALQTREQHIKRDKATSNICTAQVLLAVMAGMYAVYHGPDGLRYIANKVHEHTLILADGLKRNGYQLVHNSFFDTITVQANRSDVEPMALSKHVNLNFIDEQHVSISINETTNEEDIAELISLFPNKTQADENTLSLDEFGMANTLRRPHDFLTQEVFNRYHSETELMRYVKRLERKDLALNHSMIALGSCTMKLNAATEMLPLSDPNWAGLHPLVPLDQAQGYQEMLRALENQLTEITGFAATSLQPNSGAQGEYAGLMVIRAYHHSRGDQHRDICLIPSSAHGTNPASAVMAGMKVVVTKASDDGNIDVEDLREKALQYKDNLAALMITYPSTHGVYESAIKEITSIIHECGGQVYMDGANMNAQVALTHPGAIGADVCHLNLHKTFAIPHGGGGPGVGPICVASQLAPFLPSNPVIPTGGTEAITAISGAPWGSALACLISYGYICMLGESGLRKATEIAILNANYIKERLKGVYETLYTGEQGRAAHEMILDCRPFKQYGIEVTDIAKRLMDYGYHAPTVSFPVAGTVMVEPTESESKAELDRFCDAMIAIRREIDMVSVEQGDNPLKNAPHTLAMVTAEEWTMPYSRQEAAFPLPYLRDNKFWPAVRRVDDAYGDRNLICTCTPIEAYA